MTYIVDLDVFNFISTLQDGSVDLFLTDPPYMNIVEDSWDNQWKSVQDYVTWMMKVLEAIKPKMKENGSILFFGGVGKDGERPFFKLMEAIETKGLYHYRNLITWKKRRAYGKSHDYLFCREEIAWYSMSPERTDVTFNIPLTNVKRGYSGYKRKINVGKINLCYHTNIAEEISECACLSPESQARSKRDVLAMLQAMASESESGNTSPETNIHEKLLSTTREQNSADGVAKTAKRQQSSSVGVSESENSSQEKRAAIHFDRTKLARHLDKYVSCFGNTDTSSRRKLKQPNLGGQGGQLCWVCTWECSHNLIESQSVEERCSSLGTGENCGIHESLIEQQIVVTDSRILHRAKSDFLRVSNVWDDIPELMRPERNTQKPIPLMERFIKTHSNPGDLVVDPFSGWGTTGVAALRLGRRFQGSERIPADAKAANERCEAAAKAPPLVTRQETQEQPIVTDTENQEG